jgi:hypothetical protein
MVGSFCDLARLSFWTQFVPTTPHSDISRPAIACFNSNRDRNTTALTGRSMTVEYLRDNHYHIIGAITTESSGKQIARDAHYHRVGEYDPRSDQTRDSHYRIVGTGNQLAALIWRTIK